jgi:hypothetical protein
MRKTLQVAVLTLLTLGGGTTQDAVAQRGPSAVAVSAAPSPDAYVLTAAYPNPFRGSAKFNLTVRQRQQVKIQLFNMLGQPVRDIYSGSMEAGETKTFVLEAGDLPSGIYIYRVRGEHFTAARQITLLK